MTPASGIAIVGLRKSFGATRAVDGIDLAVPVGSFCGLVGPNGAGKTTTISMLSGLLRPDAGHVTIDGVDVWRVPEDAKRRFGLVPDTPALFERLSGHEVIEFHGLLRGLHADLIEERRDELLAALGLTDAGRRIVADYSLGMTKKLALACALLHAPRVLILDEPFGAIDPVSIVSIERILRQFTAGGGTVLFSSHVMDVVDRLCDHIAILASGRIVASGPLAEIAGGERLQDAFVRLIGHDGDDLPDLDWLAADGSAA